jgi:hypothetical protein
MAIRLRISNKYWSLTALKHDLTKQLRLRKWVFQSSLAHHCSESFHEIRHQFHTLILLSNWIWTNQQTSIWNLGSDAYFEYTSCYFKVVTNFVRNLFRVRLPYFLLLFVATRRFYSDAFMNCIGHVVYCCHSTFIPSMFYNMDKKRYSFIRARRTHESIKLRISFQKCVKSIA